MNVDILTLAHFFGEDLVGHESFPALDQVAFYNGIRVGAPVIAAGWSFVGSGIWRRRVYGLVGSRLCTTVESASSELASRLDQKMTT